MKKAGIGLSIPGWIITGLGLLVVGAAFGIDDSDRDSVLRTGLGMSIVGLALAIPGTVLIALGNKRMRAALASAQLPRPSVAYDPETRSAHLTLSIRF